MMHRFLWFTFYRPPLRHLLVGGLLAGLMGPLWSVPAQADTRVLDDFRYDAPAAAHRVWRAVADSPSAHEARAGHLTLPLPFASTTRDRVYWDRAGQWDLSGFDSLTLEVSSPQPHAMRMLGLYLKSGDGWYVWSQTLPSPGRHTLTFMRADAQTEGTPAGWERIETIRLSPWKGDDVDSTLTLHRLTAHNPDILMLLDDRLTGAERNVARRTARRISQWLSASALSHTLIENAELNQERLSRSRLLILPYNPQLTAAQRSLIDRFTQQGGRVIVFYSSDDELARLLGFRLGAYQSSSAAGEWAAMHFPAHQELHLPERVYQNSWNIRPAHPASDRARVLAHWENAMGQPTGDPAWTLSDRGLWMAHILLQGDDENKRQMLSALCALLHPPLRESIARQAMEYAGRIGPYGDGDATRDGIRSAARGRATRREINRLLSIAEEMEQRMIRRYRLGQYPETIQLATHLRQTLLDAYAMAQTPQRNEFRGVWDHPGTGLYPGDWERTARLLADHGITAIFPNVLWGGVAHYASEVLPRSATFRMYGDQLQQSIDAARKHGLEVHLWIVCGNLTGAPDDFVARMRTEGRLMATADGEELRWLNPAHPANVRLMLDSLREAATRYDLDGIHLDYIRYPNRQACYAPYTRARLEAQLGRPVARWPQDALPGGRDEEAYRQFRVHVINDAVRKVHDEIKQQHPHLRLSAAVWGGYPDIIHSIAQDWPVWLRNNWVDFVTPMNYTTDAARFTQWTRNQLALPHARGRILPGIGVTSSESQLSPDQVIQQINETRRLGANGWVLFDLNNSLRSQTLPALQKGITRE